MRPLINRPHLWIEQIKLPSAFDNKYTRGHTVILGGGGESGNAGGKLGAAKLASLSALRAGAGLVTICCGTDALIPYETWASSVMIHKTETAEEFLAFVQDDSVKSVLIGVGSGINERTKQIVLGVLRLKKPCVLDADAITVFQQNPNELFENLHPNVVLTPHIGEFNRIFNINESDKVKLVTIASKQAGCTILLKGSETIISSQNSQDVKIIINNNAPPWLATAGSGDVLSGIITGLISSGSSISISAFDAACIGVWIHGEAGNLCGIGMISEDLPVMIKTVMQKLRLLKIS